MHPPLTSLMLVRSTSELHFVALDT